MIHVGLEFLQLLYLSLTQQSCQSNCAGMPDVDNIVFMLVRQAVSVRSRVDVVSIIIAKYRASMSIEASWGIHCLHAVEFSLPMGARARAHVPLFELAWFLVQTRISCKEHY